MILESDLLFFVGIETSGIMAQYSSILFSSSLFTFSLTITNHQNSPVYFLPSQLDNHVCLIVSSVSGQNEDVIDYMNRFRIHPIKIISITDSANSPIAKLSNLNIPYYINIEMYKETNITSQIPFMYIIEYLSRQVYYQKHYHQEILAYYFI